MLRKTRYKSWSGVNGIKHLQILISLDWIPFRAHFQLRKFLFILTKLSICWLFLECYFWIQCRHSSAHGIKRKLLTNMITEYLCIAFMVNQVDLCRVFCHYYFTSLPQCSNWNTLTTCWSTTKRTKAPAPQPATQFAGACEWERKKPQKWLSICFHSAWNNFTYHFISVFISLFENVYTLQVC